MTTKTREPIARKEYRPVAHFFVLGHFPRWQIFACGPIILFIYLLRFNFFRVEREVTQVARGIAIYRARDRFYFYRLKSLLSVHGLWKGVRPNTTRTDVDVGPATCMPCVDSVRCFFFLFILYHASAY